jgi:aldose sugar dehydrogenase
MLDKYAIVRMILFTALISGIFLSSVSYFLQDKKNADALERNYPESALPSPLGPVIKDPALRAAFGHRGMLGIAVSDNNSSLGGDSNRNSSISSSNNNDNLVSKYVFLYYTASQKEDGEDVIQGKQPLGNVVYRYEFVNSKLINPKLLLDLPATPGAIGNGGKIVVGPKDKNLYISIGGVGEDVHKTKAQNVKNGGEPDGTSGILVISQDEKAVSQNGILGNKELLNNLMLLLFTRLHSGVYTSK